MSDVVLGKEKPVEESNPEYEKLKHYIFELENHLAEAQKHAYRLVKRHRGNEVFKGSNYFEMPFCFSDLGLCFALSKKWG